MRGYRFPLTVTVALFVWALLVTFCSAVELVAPKEPVEVDEYVQIGIKGIDAANLPKSKLFLWPPEQTTVLKMKDWDDQASIMFRAKIPTRYSIWMVVPGANGLVDSAQAVITVKAKEPPPEPKPPKPPGPEPPQPPNPTAKWQVAFMVQSDRLDDLPRPQQAVVASLVLRQQLAAKGHQFVGSWDPDACTTGKCPTSFSPWFTAARGKDPCILLAPLAGGTITAYPLPANEAELWKLLGGAQ